MLSLEEALQSEQVRTIGAMREVSVHGQKARIPSIPVHIAGTPEETLSTPDLGQHTDEILAQLGIDRGRA